MNRGFRAAAAASLALVATGGHAAQVAGTPPCLTSGEANALFLGVAPELVQSVVTTCTRTLPANSYLMAHGAGLVARYRAQALGARHDAAAALSKMLNGVTVDEKMFEVLAGPMISVAMADSVKPESCGRINEVLELIDPMPPANLSRLIVVILEMSGERKGAKPPPFTICKPGA